MLCFTHTLRVYEKIYKNLIVLLCDTGTAAVAQQRCNDRGHVGGAVGMRSGCGEGAAVTRSNDVHTRTSCAGYVAHRPSVYHVGRRALMCFVTRSMSYDHNIVMT